MGVSLPDLERAEAEGWADIASNASDEFRERFGLELHTIRDVVALIAPKTDMLAMNRAWLPGRDGRIAGDILEEIVETFRAKGVVKMLLHCPQWAVTDADMEMFVARGFKSVGTMTKLVRRAEQTAHASAFTIREIDPAESVRFGEIAALGNDAPPTMIPGFNSTVGLSGWRHYLAYDGPNAVAAAALRTRGSVAWCCFAGTRPEYRRRGAQSALLARRVQDASSAGCEWVTCETLSETPERPVQSLRNMLRAGFDRAYDRLTFVSG